MDLESRSLSSCSPKMLFVFTFCETDDCIDYMNCCFVLYLTHCFGLRSQQGMEHRIERALGRIFCDSFFFCLFCVFGAFDARNARN